MKKKFFIQLLPQRIEMKVWKHLLKNENRILQINDYLIIIYKKNYKSI